MSDLPPLRFQPLQPSQFQSLPNGFDYEHEISSVSDTSAFDSAVDARDDRCCIVCGKRAHGGPHPGVQRAYIIDQTETDLWSSLKTVGFVPSSAKSVQHEPRNGINLCVQHRSDFEGYRFFIRWVPSERVFVFVNFSRDPYIEEFHGKTVRLDPGHHHSPFPAPFLVQEMRTRGFHPWFTDRDISRPLFPTCTPGEGGKVAVPSTEVGGSQQNLVLRNPFQDPALLESMRREWQQLPSWKSTMVEGLTWEGTAEENARKYIDLVGASADV